MIMTTPLSHLYWWGKVFPCCQKEEDKSARQSLMHLDGKKILWHTGTSRAASARAAVGVITSFFSPKKSSSSVGSGGDGSNVVEAQWKMIDNEEGIPEIQIIRISRGGTSSGGGDDMTDEDFSEKSDNSASSPRNNNNNILRIPLKRVQQVQAIDKDIIALLPANVPPPSADGSAGGNSNKHKQRELVRFQIEEQERNDFIHHLHVLMEWDRQRRNNVGELEYEETSIAARAKKAAHFARRELEMKQTKRDREKRKAKYVSESGGLKYTAIALANNSK